MRIPFLYIGKHTFREKDSDWLNGKFVFFLEYLANLICDKFPNATPGAAGKTGNQEHIDVGDGIDVIADYKLTEFRLDMIDDNMYLFGNLIHSEPSETVRCRWALPRACRQVRDRRSLKWLPAPEPPMLFQAIKRRRVRFPLERMHHACVSNLLELPYSARQLNLCDKRSRPTIHVLADVFGKCLKRNHVRVNGEIKHLIAHPIRQGRIGCQHTIQLLNRRQAGATTADHDCGDCLLVVHFDVAHFDFSFPVMNLRLERQPDAKANSGQRESDKRKSHVKDVCLVPDIPSNLKNNWKILR